MRAQIAGDIDRAEQLGMEALQIGSDSGEPTPSSFSARASIVVNLQRGTLGELVPAH